MSSYVTSPIPNAGVYGEMSALALKAWNQAKSALRAKQGQIWQQYGFEGEFDEETGSPKNTRLTANNPYGSYQQMLHRQGGQLDEADEEAEARGLGSRGLGAQQGRKMRYAHGAESVDWGRNFASAQASVSNDWQQAGFAYQQALLDAQRAAMQDAIANRQFNEAPADAPAEATVSPGGNPAAAPPQLYSAGHTVAPGTVKPNTITQLAKAAKAAGTVMTANALVGAPQSAPAAPRATKFYTTRKEVDAVARKTGGTVKFQSGRGYYID